MDNVSNMLENISPCAIKDGNPKSIAEDERAESPDKKHAVHHQQSEQSECERSRAERVKLYV